MDADGSDAPTIATTPLAGREAAPPLRSFDIILAGDVLYKQTLLAPFLGTVRDMLVRDGQMILCHVPRAGVTYNVVEQALVEAGFRFQVLDGVKGNGGVGGTGHTPAAVGGIELCVDDARRARLYAVRDNSKSG